MFNIIIIEKPAYTPGGLAEERSENRLTVRGIGFGWATYEYLPLKNLFNTYSSSSEHL